MRKLLTFLICLSCNLIFAQKIEFINVIDSNNRKAYDEVNFTIQKYPLNDFFNENDTLHIYFNEAYLGGKNFHTDISLSMNGNSVNFSPIDFMELPYPKNNEQLFIRLKIYCKMKDEEISIDGFIYQQKLYVNLKYFCFYHYSSLVKNELLIKEFIGIDSVFRNDLQLKQKDSLFMLNYLVYKYPHRYCPRLGRAKNYTFRISKEVLPKYEATMDLSGHQFYASTSMVVSNNKYLEIDHCNTSKYDVVFFIYDESYFDGNSKNKLIRRNYNYVNNEYFIMSLDFKIIRHGVFSYDNLEYFRQ
jgi:hypothetical protein